MTTETNDFNYPSLFSTAIAQVDAARSAIAVSVNTTAISTYWNLGKCPSDGVIVCPIGALKP